MTEERSSHGPGTGGSPPVEAAGGRRPARWRTRGRLSVPLLLCILVVYPVASLLFRLRYRHGDRIPARGPVLLVVNHVSVLDPLACARLVFDHGRIPHFLAKEAVFTGLAGTILRSAGQIPVVRYSTVVRGSLDAAQADLRAGNLLRPGLRAPVDALVGEPIDLSAVRAEVRAGRPLNAELLRETTDLMMSRVRDQLAELRGEPPPLAVHPGAGRRRSDGPAGSAA